MPEAFESLWDAGWAGRDLNPHAFMGQEILSLSCLPIPPPALGGTYRN